MDIKPLGRKGADMETKEITHALQNCEFFKGLGESEISKIASLCQLKIYRAGETVFRQGDFGENLYVITDGQVFLERSLDLGMQKGSVVTAILGAGRVLGCWSTLLGTAHNLMSSAVCQRPTKLAALRGADLREIMIENREFGFNVLERLCFLLRDRIQGAYGALEKI